VADSGDLAKQAGNQEAAARARAILLKWVADSRRSVQTLRMRFSARRERLSLLLHVSEFINFQPVFEAMEKRFQTKISSTTVSPREISSLIGGVGVCGCMLCCSNGVCERTTVDVKMAKQQSIPLHDSVATGLCGKLKCCVGYELDQSGTVGVSAVSAQ
jgi:cell fate regulator YaaT (PSP1 superfamily)